MPDNDNCEMDERTIEVVNEKFQVFFGEYDEDSNKVGFCVSFDERGEPYENEVHDELFGCYEGFEYLSTKLSWDESDEVLRKTAQTILDYITAASEGDDIPYPEAVRNISEGYLDDNKDFVLPTVERIKFTKHKTKDIVTIDGKQMVATTTKWVCNFPEKFDDYFRAKVECEKDDDDRYVIAASFDGNAVGLPKHWSYTVKDDYDDPVNHLGGKVDKFIKEKTKLKPIE